MKVYHGTSYENFKQIQELGFGASQSHIVWDCSDRNATYVWSPAALVEAGEVEDDEYATSRAVQMAFESAQITAALYGSTQDRVIVLEIEVPGDEDLMVDDSCENMGCARYFMNSAKHQITGCYESPYYPDLRLFYLKGLNGNQWLRLCVLPDVTAKALALIPSDVYLEELLESIETDNYHSFQALTV